MTLNRPKIALGTVVALLLVLALWARIKHESAATNSPVTFEQAKRYALDHPHDLKAMLDWGEALQKQGSLQDAEAAFMAADRLDLKDSRAAVWLGILSVQQKRNSDAVRWFREALIRSPGDADVWRSLADVLQSERDLKAAADCYEHVTRLRPNDAQAWTALGKLDVRRKMLGRAHEELANAVKLDRADVAAQSAFGSLSLQLGRLPDARKALQFVVEHNPNDAAALARLARASVQLDSSPDGLKAAMDLAERSIGNEPTPEGYLARGQVHLQQKEFGPAIADLKNAIKANSNMPAAYGYLSEAYSAAGKPADSRRAAEQYLAANKRNAIATGGASQ